MSLLRRCTSNESKQEIEIFRQVIQGTPAEHPASYLDFAVLFRFERCSQNKTKRSTHCKLDWKGSSKEEEL